jgi:hypothetical protein
MSVDLPAEWAARFAEHDASCREYIAAVRGVAAEQWALPLAPAKWSPAEITGHLIEAYRILRGEMAGRPGMRVVVPPVRRWILRHIMMPQLLRSGRFATGVRAPKETRPRTTEATPEGGIAMLEAQVSGFVRELEEQLRRGPIQLTHAFFGLLDGRQALRLCTVHTRHHARQLARAGGLPTGGSAIGTDYGIESPRIGRRTRS